MNFSVRFITPLLCAFISLQNIEDCWRRVQHRYSRHTWTDTINFPKTCWSFPRGKQIIRYLYVDFTTPSQSSFTVFVINANNERS